MVESANEHGAISPLNIAELPKGHFRELFGAWLSWARAKNGVPLRSEFDPVNFKRLLPHLTLFKVSRESAPRYLVKLVGGEIIERMGTNTTGRWLDEMPATEKVQARCQWLCESRRAYFIANQPVAWVDAKGHMEYDCLGLPLTGTGEQVDEILYLMIFHGRHRD